MKPLSQCRPRGWTRCTWHPWAGAGQRPSTSRSTLPGLLRGRPASATAIDIWTGSLATLVTPSTSPASFILTITDRRRCRSMPTYCCSCTRSPFLLEGFGFAPPSFVLLGLLGERDFAVLLVDCLATGSLATTIASDRNG